MTKIIKNNQSKIRARIFRGVESILRGEERAFNVIQVTNHLPTIRNHLAQNSKLNRQSLADELRSWVLSYRIKRRAVTGLLKVSKLNGMSFLPQELY